MTPALHLGSLYSGPVRFYLGCDRIKKISSAEFIFDPTEAAAFVSYTRKVDKDIWKKGGDVALDSHPRLKTLRHKGKRCYNEVYFVEPQEPIILILAGSANKYLDYLLGFDTQTNMLTPHVVYMNEDGEWDEFNVETPKSKMVELVK